MEIIVVFDDRTGGGIERYQSVDLFGTLKKIADKHIFPSRKRTIPTLLEFIDGFNGDGTDFIFVILVEGKVYFEGLNVVDLE